MTIEKKAFEVWLDCHEDICCDDEVAAAEDAWRDAIAWVRSQYEPSGTAAARDVLAERRRQIEAEGWTPEHDDDHFDGSLAEAAATYALSAARNGLPPAAFLDVWPHRWQVNWFKPKSPREDLVRAGALILAEIERLDRMPHNVEVTRRHAKEVEGE